MKHWTKTRNQFQQQDERQPAAVTAVTLSAEAQMEMLDRLRQAIVQHLITESSPALCALIASYRGTLLGDAAATALEMRNVLPDEFCSPARLIRRNI
jgi:hypothetical protein